MRYQYGQVEKPKKSKKRFVVVALIFIAVIALVVGWLLVEKNKAEAPNETPVVKIEDTSDVSSVTAKYLFSGTVVPARAVENEARRPDGSIDYNQPFSKLDTFNPSQYDGWTVDMECPVTDADIPYRQQVTNTMFNCRPEFLRPMSKYFTVMNFANNHVYDRGKDKFPQMQKYIEEAGIQHVGNQDPAAKKDVCEVMAMKVNLQKNDGTTEEGTLPIAYCAWHYFEREPLPGEFDVIKKYAEIMPVFGLMQVGQEYVAKAGADQEKVGRSIIDGGAEFVVGNSPHWVQNSDVYKNKLIFYSTGNFIFDQLDEETNRGASVVVSMKIDYDKNVAKWLVLGESCKDYNDDCIAKAKEQKLTKIQPKLTFDLVASTTGYRKITQKANDSVFAAVKQRTNWVDTLTKLGQQ